MTFFERILLIFCRILLILLLLWHSIINRHRYRCQKRLFIFADIAFWEYQIFICIYQFLGKVSGTTWEPWIHLGIHWDYFGPYSYRFFGQLKHWIRFLLTNLLGELFNCLVRLLLPTIRSMHQRGRTSKHIAVKPPWDTHSIHEQWS